MENNSKQLTSNYVAPSLALTLLCMGLSYSLPFALYPASHSLNGPMSPEILNLYFLVAWAGLAHFVYAYYGQAKSLSRTPAKIFPFVCLLLVGAITLIFLRHILGYMLFSFSMWVYFWPHFIRAELHFTSILEQKDVHEFLGVYLFPTIAFIFFTFVLFCPESIVANRWNLILLALGCLATGIPLGVTRQLQSKDLSKYALLAIFLIAEGLIWATYRKYMVFQFQQGVYIFHIAMASFYHYFRSYDFARRMGITKGTPVKWTYTGGVVAVNLLIILLGFLIVNMYSSGPFRFVFDVSYFTFWVGLHQFSSDVFNWLKTSTLFTQQKV